MSQHTNRKAFFSSFARQVTSPVCLSPFRNVENRVLAISQHRIANDRRIPIEFLANIELRTPREDDSPTWFSSAYIFPAITSAMRVQNFPRRDSTRADNSGQSASASITLLSLSPPPLPLTQGFAYFALFTFSISQIFFRPRRLKFTFRRGGEGGGWGKHPDNRSLPHGMSLSPSRTHFHLEFRHSTLRICSATSQTEFRYTCQYCILFFKKNSYHFSLRILQSASTV